MSRLTARRALMFLVGGVVVLGLCALAVRRQSVRHAVIGQLARPVSNGAFGELPANLIRLGPDAIPVYREILERSQAGGTGYSRFWSNLPEGMRRVLPLPEANEAMRSRLFRVLPELGPAVARPLTGVLVDRLNEANAAYAAEIWEALFWALPDSSAALRALGQWLENPDRGLLPSGGPNEAAVWARLPEMAPLLAHWLANIKTAGAAARALEAMGNRAVAATPDLIRACRYRERSSSDALNLVLINRIEDAGVSARCAALRALAAIAGPGPELQEACREALEDSEEDLRVTAFVVWMRMGASGREKAIGALNRLKLTSAYRVQQVVEAIAAAGPQARGAMPWLRELILPRTLKQFERSEMYSIKASPEVWLDPEELRISALIAMGRVEPQSIGPDLRFIIDYSGRRRDAAAILLELPERKEEIIRRFLPLLSNGERDLPALAASIILKLEPQHRESMQTLNRRCESGPLEHRLSAARWLFERTGRESPLVALIPEALKDPTPATALLAASLASMDGLEVQQFIPSLKRALWHPDDAVRLEVGRILYSFDPKQLPDIE
jgi:hypothetical protein